MELTGLQVQQQPATLTGLDTATTAQSSQETHVTSDVVLTGESVKVRTTTDFQKLLAEMDSEREDKKIAARQSQLAAAMAVMAGQYTAATAALNDVCAASDAVSAAASDVSAAQASLDASTAALAVATAELEAMNEAYATTPEDREKAVEKKEEQQEVTDQQRMDQAAIEEQKQKVAELTSAVAQDKQDLAQAEAEKATADQALAAALATLDSSAYRVVVDAGISAAKALRETVQERLGGADDLSVKVDAVIAALGEYVDKVEEMQQEDLRQAVMKTAPYIAFLAAADSTLAASELPGRENHV